MQDIIFKLVKAGLSLREAELYMFILNHPACCLRDACKYLQQSKSSIYRAFQSLIRKNLIQTDTEDWQYNPRVESFECVLNMLKKQHEQNLQLIHYFEGLEESISGSSHIAPQKRMQNS